MLWIIAGGICHAISYIIAVVAGVIIAQAKEISDPKKAVGLEFRESQLWFLKLSPIWAGLLWLIGVLFIIQAAP